MTTETTQLSREERMEKSKQKSLDRKKKQANERVGKKHILRALKESNINLRYWHLGGGWTVSFGYREFNRKTTVDQESHIIDKTTFQEFCFTIKSPADKFSRPKARENILACFENNVNIFECTFKPQATFVSDQVYETVMHIKLTFLLMALMQPNLACFSKKFIRFLCDTYLPANPLFD